MWQLAELRMLESHQYEKTMSHVFWEHFLEFIFFCWYVAELKSDLLVLSCMVVNGFIWPPVDLNVFLCMGEFLCNGFLMLWC